MPYKIGVQLGLSLLKEKMMFCINCGIEMTEGQKICPICQTRVYHPDLKKTDALPSYPRKAFKSEEINIKGLLFVVTLLHLIPMLFAVILDLNLNGHIDWTGYVVGAVLFLYVSAVLPMWFKKHSPVVFVPVSVVTLTCYLWYINFSLESGWFWTFACPVVLMLGTIVTVTIALLRRLKKGRLYVIGGLLLFIGLFVIAIEQLLHVTFEFMHDSFIWSLYPMAFLGVMGGGLIVIESVKPFKESLKKIFFL